MTPSQLRDLAKLAEIRKQLELAQLRPELVARERIADEIAGLRARLAREPQCLEDPELMLQETHHRALLDRRLRERLQNLSRVEARIAMKSPAFARATARKNIADKLLEETEIQRRKERQVARNALSNQLTS